MSVEVRRVQRLGGSSLVVTIPKEWAAKLGIKAGSRVYLIDEGDSIRILPSLGEPAPQAPVRLDLSKLSERLAVNAVNCVYLAGFSNVLFNVKEGDVDEIVYQMRMKTDSLMGVDVSSDRDGVKVRVLIDNDRIDVSNLIKSLGFNAVKLLSVLARALESGELGERDYQEAEFLWREYTRYQHMIIRYLITRRLREANVIDVHQTSLAASYLGFANDILWSTVRMMRKIRFESSPEWLSEVLPVLERLLTTIPRLVVTPNLKRLDQAHVDLNEARRLVEGALQSERDPGRAVVLAKLHDALRVLTIVFYVAMCKTILAQLSGGDGSRPR